MAQDRDLTVSYSVDPAGLSGAQMRLPQVSRRMTRDEVLLARGTADALALHRRYHDDTTHARYLPQGQMARELYEAMETARCEAMGARVMPGTAGNIDAKIGQEADRKGYAQITQSADAPLSTAAGYLIRHLATGRDLPRGAQNVMELWRGFIEEQAAGTLDNLDGVLDNQAAFAKFARQMISDLGYGDQLGDDPDQDDTSSDDNEPTEEDQDSPDSQGQDDDSTEETDAEADQSQDEQDSAQAEASLDEMGDLQEVDETDMPEADAPLEPPPPAPSYPTTGSSTPGPWT